MNHDQIKALKERADKAMALADRYAVIATVKKVDDLPHGVRDEALRLAKAGILTRIEAEVNELLNGKAEPVQSCVMCGNPCGAVSCAECEKFAVESVRAPFIDPLPKLYQPAEPGHGTSTYAPCATPTERGT